jgi:O-antigen/teichoic acid export membrane protein
MLGLLFIPLYVRFLGIEAFGLVGLYVTLQSVLAVVDFGVSPTVNRELARFVSRPGEPSAPRDLVRSFEAPYWTLGVLLGGTLAAVSPLLASHWIASHRLDAEEVRRAFVIMGLATALQWPLTLYQGGLMGLQRPALLQAINASAVTFRTVGTVLMLWLVSRSIVAFFWWQALSAAVHTAAAAYFLWRSLPASDSAPRVRLRMLRDRWRFMAGVGATSAVALLLTQMDKVILSKVASLETFGYYMLAGAIADALYKLLTPIHATLFPQFSSLVVRGEQAVFTTLYHRACQLMTAVLSPAGLMLAFFSRELIWLWTFDERIVAGTAPIVRVVVLGTVLNGLMSLPYAAQLAHGWVRLGFLANVSALLILSPVTFALTVRFGPLGAAATWVILNGAYVLIVVPLMHRRILKGELRRWYWIDVLIPSAAAVLVVVAARWLMPVALHPALQFAVFALTYAAAAIAAALAAPDLRAWAMALGRDGRLLCQI